MAIASDQRQLTLAARIKVARVGAGLDQKHLADNLGVARSTISHWERGGAQPPLGQAVALARVTGVTLEWLAEGVEVTEQLQINYWLFASDFSIPDSPSELIETWSLATLRRAEIDSATL